ncbi:hypothetical protein [Halorubrum laminariae]|uniref:hypothetical protein n=1 Tax=Halorubrum laminariae TaxID=1433523 RepID=UPI0021135285|nr:hypothetical protein [Halorubrum laminariae]
MGVEHRTARLVVFDRHVATGLVGEHVHGVQFDPGVVDAERADHDPSVGYSSRRPSGVR